LSGFAWASVSASSDLLLASADPLVNNGSDVDHNTFATSASSDNTAFLGRKSATLGGLAVFIYLSATLATNKLVGDDFSNNVTSGIATLGDAFRLASASDLEAPSHPNASPANKLLLSNDHSPEVLAPLAWANCLYHSWRTFASISLYAFNTHALAAPFHGVGEGHEENTSTPVASLRGSRVTSTHNTPFDGPINPTAGNDAHVIATINLCTEAPSWT